jgi:hypothetical protein
MAEKSGALNQTASTIDAARGFSVPQLISSVFADLACNL